MSPFFKKCFAAAVLLVLAFWGAWFWAELFTGDGAFSFNEAIPFGIVFFFWSISLLLSYAVIEDKIWGAGLVGAATLPFLILTPTDLNYYVLGGWVLFFAAALWGFYEVSGEMAMHVKVKFRKLADDFLPILFTTFAIMAAVQFATSPIPKDLSGESVIPESFFNISYLPIEKMIQSKFPFFDSEMNVDEFLVGLAIFSGNGAVKADEKLLQDFVASSGGADFKNAENLNLGALLKDKEAAKAFRDMIRQQAKRADKANIEQLRDNFAAQFGTEISGEDTLRTALYKAINGMVIGFVGAYLKFFPALIGLAIFFSVKALSYPFYWLVIIGASVSYKILRRFGIIKVEMIMVRQEVPKI